MKRPKDRLQKVIVIGATPAGVAAANKLGELGIPVTLIDRDPDLDEKLSKEEWRLSSGTRLNFAHRPGLLRIFRNPMIRCVIPAEITLLKHTPQGFRGKLRKNSTFVDASRCTLCGLCAEVCPVVTPEGKKPIRFNGRGSLPGRPVIDKRKQPPCQAGCPLGVNVQAYIALARVGRIDEALELIRRDNVLPGVCGRICTHPCEAGCRRGELDEPLAIKAIKRFIADSASSIFEKAKEAPAGKSEKIAVVGSGPAGLAAAADLAREGYRVVVFEKERGLGGLLRYGIGPHRLPREILDREIGYIQELGVEFKPSSPVDPSKDLPRLREEFDAVLLTTGTWFDRKLGVPGEEMEGIEGGIAFLNRVYRDDFKKPPAQVAVIGDGNAAFDLARVLRRLGAGVTLISWFPKEMVPADAEEVRGAQEEEVHFIDRTQVVAFTGENGHLKTLRCKATEPGEPDAAGIPWPVPVPEKSPFDLPFDHAIVAIGQRGPFDSPHDPLPFQLTDSGYVAVEGWRTSLGRVYAAGDAVTGPSAVVEAMATGRQAARRIRQDLGGTREKEEHWIRPIDGAFAPIPSHIPSLCRPTMPEIQSTLRTEGFSEVALGLGNGQAMMETERCLQCGVCSECLLCAAACERIDHGDEPEETFEHAGVLIVADPELAPSIKGEDVIRAYGPKTAKTDVYAMMIRGFAAAAKAVTLLGGTAQRPKGSGLSFSPPDPELSPEIRIGVFVCRCNAALGWTDGMEGYVLGLTHREGVVHGESLPAACTPEGSAGILRVIRQKGLSRVVLASCICCPLDFICSACTDQRSRLKDALFRGTGISRSMVETCNVRGEALSYIQLDPSIALSRFQGLIDRSIQRAGRLKRLPSPARTYNFTTAVIGESESARSAALTLAESGLDVFLFGTMGKPLIETPEHPNIHSFEGSSVEALSGTLGDFHVFVKSGDFHQRVQVGAVILGENSRKRIPYIPQEGLPSRIVASAMQKRGTPGVPFLYPGATSIAGLFLANPPGIMVSEKKKGASAAALAAAVMPRGPRQSKGYTIVVDKEICRGCGRCIRVCPYQAISFEKNLVGGWFAKADEALCKGCGICISVCPSHAADSPYRDQTYLEQMLEEILVERSPAARP
jgi:NADPH-dependent glutamate synthase beta subunit-like oxidoreductase/Pyruvate/2-oxoacid:ferredoxin oxidoreductase delta subunit